jgi:hypothetical protein
VREHAALLKIEYADKTKPPSVLLYIKASLSGDEPADVLQYRLEHSDFPHESTSDQFFGESQWESYRRLGEHVAMKVLDEVPTPESTADNLWLRRLVTAGRGK